MIHVGNRTTLFSELSKFILMKFSKKNNSLFYKEVKKRINNYFQENQTNSYATAGLWLKGVILVSIYLSTYFLILLGNLESSTKLILAIIMGLSAVMIVFNLVHDASHNALFKQKKWNKWVCYLGDFVGINTYIWDIRHNIQHHTFTNILGGDIIIENIPLIRLTEHQSYKRHHRFQVYYAPLMYAFYTLYWIFVIDFKLFFKKNICNLHHIKHPLKEWMKLWFFKAFYVFYMLVLPLLILDLPWYQVVAGFLIMNFFGGVLLSTVALLGHFVEGPVFPHPNHEGLIENSWGEHELDATIDFANKSRICHWITGGLNTHIAHHLFPYICHIHYFEMVKIIRQTCKDFNLTYKEESFWQAIISHFRYLNRLSHP